MTSCHRESSRFDELLLDHANHALSMRPITAMPAVIRVLKNRPPPFVLSGSGSAATSPWWTVLQHAGFDISKETRDHNFTFFA
jgi:hypothetical protein